jgi:hypothetical protein
MDQDIRVGMTNGTFPGGNVYPADPELMSFLERVNIKAKAYTYFHKLIRWFPADLVSGSHISRSHISRSHVSRRSRRCSQINY